MDHKNNFTHLISSWVSQDTGGWWHGSREGSDLLSDDDVAVGLVGQVDEVLGAVGVEAARDHIGVGMAGDLTGELQTDAFVTTE